jgi:hydrogenase-4 membrane subunit HyfE
MSKKVSYYAMGILICLFSMIGIVWNISNGSETSLLIIFMGLFLLGLFLVSKGYRIIVVKKEEFVAGIINLNGNRKLHEVEE